METAVLHFTMCGLGHSVLISNDGARVALIIMLIDSEVALIDRLLKHLFTERRVRLLLCHHLCLFIAHWPRLRFCHPF